MYVRYRGDGIDLAGFAELPPLNGFASDFLYRRWYRRHIDVAMFIPDLNGGASVARESAMQLSVQDFVERYDKGCRPVVLTDIPQFEKGSSNRVRRICRKAVVCEK